MNDSFLKKHSIVSLLLGIALVILGIFVLMQDEKLLSIALGIALIISGVSTLQVVSSFIFASKRWKIATLCKGVISIVVGLLGILYSQKSWDVMMYIMGIQMVISAVIALCDAAILKKSSNLPVGSIVSDGIFSLIVAVVLFAFPSFVGNVLVKIIGIVLLAAGLGLGVWAMRIRKIDKEFNIKAESEVIEEKDTRK
ncbi:MAG: DUF308 domain-containing protein [Sphaerochaetaceae bacterium]